MALFRFSTNEIDAIKRLLFQLDVIEVSKPFGLSDFGVLQQIRAEALNKIDQIYSDRWRSIKDRDYREIAQFLETDPPLNLKEEAEAKLSDRLTRDMEVFQSPIMQARAIAEFHELINASKNAQGYNGKDSAQIKPFIRNREQAWTALKQKPDDTKIGDFFETFFKGSSDEQGKSMMKQATLYLWTVLMKRHCPTVLIQ